MAELGRRRAIERHVMGFDGEWAGIGLGRRVRVSYRYRGGVLKIHEKEEIFSGSGD